MLECALTLFAWVDVTGAFVVVVVVVDVVAAIDDKMVNSQRLPLTYI